LNTKSLANNTNNINNKRQNDKRHNVKYTKRILSFSELGARVLASHQELLGSAR